MVSRSAADAPGRGDGSICSWLSAVSCTACCDPDYVTATLAPTGASVGDEAAVGDWKIAKHLLEFIAQLSTNSHISGLRPSASIAPTRQNQFRSSWWPDCSICVSGTSRHTS